MHHRSSFALFALSALACSDGGAPGPRVIDPSSVADIDLDELLALVRDPGERPLVLNVWGSWCGPCVAELPDLAQAAVDFPHVRFVGVGVESIADREKARAANAAVAGHGGVGYELRLAVPPAEVLFRALELSPAFPTTLVVPAGGGKPTVYVGSLSGVRLTEFRLRLEGLR